MSTGNPASRPDGRGHKADARGEATSKLSSGEVPRSGASSGRSHSQPAVVLAIGPERWLRNKFIQEFKAKVLKAGFEEMDFTRFSELPESPQAILEVLKTSPFGSSRRLVVVEGLEEIAEQTLPWLTEVLAHPPRPSLLLLCGDRFEQNRAPFVSFQRKGLVRVIFCQPLKGRELQAWIAAQAKVSGKKIDPEAATLLIQRLGNELQPLALAVESLCLLVGSAPTIGKEDVERLITPSVRETAFDILDQACAGRPEKAIGLFQRSLAQGRVTVEQLVGALGWVYRMAWKAKLGATPPAWISYNRQMALNRLARWPEKRFEEAFRSVLQADVHLKLGSPHPELLADELLLELGR